MKKNYDEPIFIDKQNNSNYSTSESTGIKSEINKLVNSEPFAVLSMKGEEAPYSSLITYAATSDLKNIAFATPVKTRKIELISKCSNVSILIDNRCNISQSINSIVAVTVSGIAKIIENQEETEKWANLLKDSHPYLKNFVEADSTSIIVIETCKYYYVRKFQEVFEWIPE